MRKHQSDREMQLIRDANVIADAMMRSMLAVLKPGMLETQVAGGDTSGGAGAASTTTTTP
jgi:Xaa-Pro aminopeptidase